MPDPNGRNVVRVDAGALLHEHWKWFRNVGIVLIVLGVLAIVLPLAAALAVNLLLGWLLLVGGAVQIGHAMKVRAPGRFWWELGIGVLYALIGLLLLVNPIAGVLSLTLLLAALFLADGAFRLILAFTMRPARGWGWLLVSGAMSLVLGLLIVSGLPGTAAWALGLMVGINLLMGGVALVSLARIARG